MKRFRNKYTIWHKILREETLAYQLLVPVQNLLSKFKGFNIVSHPRALIIDA
jgi:hypothetical protein